jgi:hypothetical protein
MLRPYHATLNELVPRVITVVMEALTTMKTDEADHIIRLRAVERSCELLEMAQGKLPGKGTVTPAAKITWEEYQERYG